MILVTGGAGLIGSALIWHLNRNFDTDIVIVDHLGTGDKWKNLVGLRYSDYLEKDELLPLLMSSHTRFHKTINGVVHLGACSDTTMADASYLYDNNYRFTVDLADWCRTYRIPFVYASSAATYGDGTSGFSDAAGTEHNLKPLNMYGYSKQMVDLYLSKQKWRSPWAGLKYFNIFGPNEWHKGEMRSVVLKAFRAIKTDGFFTLFRSDQPDFEDGGQLRDFMYVKDAVTVTAAIVRHCMSGKPLSGLFNVGRGEPVSWNRLLAAVVSAVVDKQELPTQENEFRTLLGGYVAKGYIRYGEMPAKLKGKYQNFTCADMKKTTELLGKIVPHYVPLSIENAIFEYVSLYLEHERRIAEPIHTKTDSR